MTALLEVTDAGLYCEAGDFHVDPWKPVARALITHAHADHARGGSAAYLAADAGLPLLRARLPPEASIETIRYGESRRIGAADVSFHPAGHVLGSAQIRIAHRGHVLVVSGDYKIAPDPTCAPFEPVACDTFVTESTFGLPIYRWEDPARTMEAILGWWMANQAERRASVLFAYALGKAQRILAGLALASGDLPGPVYVHGAVDRINIAYREARVALPPAPPVARSAGGYRLVAGADPGAAVGARQPLAGALRPLRNGVRVRLDGHSRPAPAREPRPRLRAVRPCGLAGPQRRDTQQHRRAKSG